MIMKIKNHRKIIIKLFILLIISSPIIMIIYNHNIKIKYINSFKDKTIRINYFNDRKENFEFIKDLMINDKIVYIGNNDYSCPKRQNSYKVSKNIYVCPTSSFENIDELKDDIYNAYKNLNIKEARFDKYDNANYTIVFLVESTWSYAVSYDYCIDENCSSDDEFTQRENYLYIRNKIDSNWSSDWVHDGER